MANLFIFANDAASSLAAPITAAATSLTVQSGQGAEFPTPSAQQQFSATLNDAATGLLTEIVYVTGVSGDTFTVVRAQEGTVAQNWLAGDLIANILTAGQMAAMVQSLELAPNRVVTSSGSFVTNASDANGSIGLLRTSGVGPSSTTLPDNLEGGNTVTYEDLVGNFQANPVTVSAPAGMSIAGLSEFVINWNRASVTFRFYADDNIFGILKSS